MNVNLKIGVYLNVSIWLFKLIVENMHYRNVLTCIK